MKATALFMGALVTALTLGSRPATADLRVCNRTSYIVYAAVGYESGTQMLTRGWTRVVPGDCTTALEGKLDQPAYFLYAQSSRAHSGPERAWGGHIRLCAKESNFAIDVPVGAARCGSDDAFLMPFAVLATGHKASWTTTFTGINHFNTNAAARGAGVARLLADIGYRVGLGSDATAGALFDFRRRLRLPATANDEQMFDALETEAQKTAAPEGYSVCNDGQAEIWAALALRAPRNDLSRGWWDVPPGACAKLLPSVLSFDSVYLFAESRHNVRLVAGSANFCISNTAFEISGTAPCRGRGEIVAGFAATETKGRAGFIAHIGNDGLLPPAPQRRGSK